MSKTYNHEIGFETLQEEWKVQCKRTPRGVTLAKGGGNIYLQFKTPNTSRSKHKCACSFSVDGMHEAVRKSHLVKAKLTSMTSEIEFWNWYKDEIQEESRLIDDRVTFDEAIKKVEDDFWSRPSRTRRTRDKSSSSDQSSWRETYGRFLEYLPKDKLLNADDILECTKRQKKGTKVYKHVVSAYKKLARLNKRQDILNKLNELDLAQTQYKDLDNVALEDFLNWRDKTIGLTASLHTNTNIESRKAWCWVFSMQVAYGLRISEVFAIKNLFEPYKTKDKVVIPALNDPNNTSNLIYVGGKTLIGTTVKTGSRIARPSIPPKCPDLMSRLDIKNPLLPNIRPTTKNHDRIRSFYSSSATKALARWDAPTTETHALRHLANINGIQAGIPQEVRAQSMGHTVQMNEQVYKKRQSTQTTIDLLLNSNSNAIDLVTALTEAKKLVLDHPEDRKIIARLLSIIYQKDSETMDTLL